MFKSMSMNTKLMIPTVLLCIVTGVVGFVGYNSLGKVVASNAKVTGEIMPDVIHTEDMFLAYRQIRIELRTLGLPGISKDQAEAAVKGAVASIEQYEAEASEYEKGLSAASAEEAALYKKVSSAWLAFKDVGTRVLALQKSGTEEDRRRMLEIFFKDCPETAKVLRTAITDMLQYQKGEAARYVSNANQDASSAVRTIFIAIVLGLGIGVVAAIFAARSASNLVANIGRVADRLAQGADKVSSVAGAVNSASQTLSSSSTQQAAAIQETTAAIEETSAMVSKNADNAKQSREIAVRSQSTASRGKDAVTEVLASIDQIAASNADIAQQIDESNHEMAEVVKVIQEIGSKTKVINDIVFQTKLLSFNASVEAARAGEQGKGFAVVAEEVGNLAQMSGNSAKEISDLLEVSTKRVQDMVARTKSKVDRLVLDSQEKVRRGTETARRCDQVLSEIVSDVSSVGSLVAEIATASQEQANGVAEVNKAISELDSAAQQNSQASSQAASSAEELDVQVRGLRKQISDLNSLVRGSSEVGAVQETNPENVIPFKTAPAPRPVAQPSLRMPARRTAGGGNNWVPSQDDPGFEEV